MKPNAAKKPSVSDALMRIQEGTSHDPFEVLGYHPLPDGGHEITAFLPAAESVEVSGIGPMQRITNTDCFRLAIPPGQAVDRHYQLDWVEKVKHYRHSTISPYSFMPQVGDLDLHLFQEGRHHHAWKFLGAQMKEIDGIEGCQFAVWAPGVQRVSIVGDFNGWDGRRHAMRCRGGSGIWELFIPGLCQGDPYKYEILSSHGHAYTKTDPYARSMSLRPENTSLIPPDSDWQWHDDLWMQARKIFAWQHQPVSIYEVHAGSWRRH